MRFSLYDREIVIVGCHLAAHLEKYEDRLLDFAAILDSQVPD